MQQSLIQRSSLILLMTACVTLFPSSVAAGEIRIAVASNFVTAVTEIASRFEVLTGHDVKLSPGSTGKHYAQIINGAPFDLFLAADEARPERLESEGYTISGTRFTYAIGELVLWSSDPGMALADGRILTTGEFRFLAIANPDLAPYGKAAREVLQALGVWEKLRKQIVIGENINQTLHFVHSGNAELGLIARSQLHALQGEDSGIFWMVPGDSHATIEQQAVLLKDSQSARAFLEFMRSEEALQIIEQYGYRSP